MKDVELTVEQQIYMDIAIDIRNTCNTIEDEQLRFRVWDANVKYLENLMSILLN